MAKEDQLCAIALIKKTYIFLGFIQYGCYDNQTHPFEALI